MKKVLEVAALSLVPIAFFALTLSIFLRGIPICVTSEVAIPEIISNVLKPEIVKAGQVWEFVGDTSDPFKENVVIDTMHVIAVKGGHVKYRDSYGNTKSESVRYFLIGSRLKKDSPPEGAAR